MNIEISPSELYELVGLFRSSIDRMIADSLEKAKSSKTSAVIKDSLERHSYSLEVNASDDGQLTTPITTNDVAEVIGVPVEYVKSDIPITELGLYSIGVQVSPNVIANVKLWVVPIMN